MQIFRAFSFALVSVVGACAPMPAGGPVPSGGLGAATPRAAVEQFLAAVRAEDIQAMSAVWGTTRGSVRGTMDRAELEQTMVILQRYHVHDSSVIVQETPGRDGRRVFQVELLCNQTTRRPTFYAVEGPQRRWYMESIDLVAVPDQCRAVMR